MRFAGSKTDTLLFANDHILIWMSLNWCSVRDAQFLVICLLELEHKDLVVHVIMHWSWCVVHCKKAVHWMLCNVIWCTQVHWDVTKCH